MQNNVLQAKLPSIQELKTILEPYSRAESKTALSQLVVTLLCYVAGWVAMVYSLQVGYWLTLLLALPTAGFLVRIFIFFHDCGHNSFFPSQKLNQRIGFWLGALVFTPSDQWWRSHTIHHATAGNLDKRGVGDVTTLTVNEYFQLSPMKRLGYRLFRNPFVMFVLGPIWMFLIQHRLPLPYYGKKETMSVVWANVFMVAMAAGISALIGFQNYLLIQLPVIWIAGAAGIWLFFVQHQFETVYWAPKAEWDFVESALKGASYYDLPKALNWFSGNIGFHHIHHLNPRVPNYYLGQAYESAEIFQQSPTFTIRESLECVKLTLIDEESGKMVTFRQAEALIRSQPQRQKVENTAN